MADAVAVKVFIRKATNKYTGILSWLLTKDHKESV